MEQQVVTPQEHSSSTLLSNDFGDMATTAREFHDSWANSESYDNDFSSFNFGGPSKYSLDMDITSMGGDVPGLLPYDSDSFLGLSVTTEPADGMLSVTSTPKATTPSQRGKKRGLEGLGDSPMANGRNKRHITMGHVHGMVSVTSSPLARSRETSANRRVDRSVSHGNALTVPFVSRNVSGMSGITAFSDDLQTPTYQPAPLADPTTFDLNDPTYFQPPVFYTQPSTISPEYLRSAPAPITAPLYSTGTGQYEMMPNYNPVYEPMATIPESSPDAYMTTPGLSYTANTHWTGHIPTQGAVPTPTMPNAPDFSPQVGFGTTRPVMARPPPLDMTMTNLVYPQGMQRAVSFNEQTVHPGALHGGPLSAPVRSSFSSTTLTMQGGLFSSIPPSTQMDRGYQSMPGMLTYEGGPIAFQPIPDGYQSGPQSATHSRDTSGNVTSPTEPKQKRQRMPSYLKPGPKPKTPQKEKKVTENVAGPSTPTPSRPVPSVLAPAGLAAPVSNAVVSTPILEGEFTSNQPVSREAGDETVVLQMLPPELVDQPKPDPTRIDSDTIEKFFKELKEGERETNPNGSKKLADPKKKQFKCLIGECGQVLARKSAAIAHIQTHMDDKPYKCRFEDCGTKFVRKHDLTRHEKIHANVKEHVCECGKQFTRQDALNRHTFRNICVGGKVDETKIPPVPKLHPQFLIQNALYNRTAQGQTYPPPVSTLPAVYPQYVPPPPADPAYPLASHAPAPPPGPVPAPAPVTYPAPTPIMPHLPPQSGSNWQQPMSYAPQPQYSSQ